VISGFDKLETRLEADLRTLLSPRDCLPAPAFSPTVLTSPSMGGHIDCYLDCSSFYSYIAFEYLLKNKDLLASHDVIVEFHPIFLGGVNVGSGNKPPWTLPAKAKYGQFDLARTLKYHDLEKVSVPPFFPPLTLLPQRALCYIKATFPPIILEKTWGALFNSMWVDHNNITLPDPFVETLKRTTLFTEKEIEDILNAAKEKEWKDKLLANTQKVLDLGAFGAPWMWVRNSEGKEEPFFGSDRFHFVWMFLGVPFRDVEIMPTGDKKAKL